MRIYHQHVFYVYCCFAYTKMNKKDFQDSTLRHLVENGNLLAKLINCCHYMKKKRTVITGLRIFVQYFACFLPVNSAMHFLNISAL